MAQDPVVRKAPAQRLLEGVDVVDALADERALAEQVLVDIRDGARVGIDARLAAEQLRIARAIRPRQAGGHARLQDAVTGHHPAFCRVVAGAVQRMRHGADQLPRRIARQLGIGIQGDHVLHGAQLGRVPGHQYKGVAGAAPAGAAQQCVQVRQLAALALIAHPATFPRIPAPRTVEQEEPVAARLIAASRVFLVQRRNPLLGQLQQRLVLGKCFLRRVRKIGQQAEVQMCVPIGQKPHLERFDQLLDAGGAGEQGRHHHQRAHLRRDACGEVHAGQGLRRHQQAGEPVHQRPGQLTGRQHRQHADRRPCPAGQVGHRHGPQQYGGDERREQDDPAQINRQRRAAERPARRRQRRAAHLHRALELRPARVDQVVTDVRGAGIGAGWRLYRRGARQLDGLARHLALVHGALFCHRLGGVAIAVAGGKIHPAVNIGRIVAQRLIDDAQVLDEIAPFQRTQHPQAADAVADGHLVGSLLLVLRLHQLGDGQARFRQALFDPAQRQGKGRTPSLQAACELGDEGADHRRIRARHVGHHQDQALGILLGGLRHPVRPDIGQVALGPAGADPHRDAAQVLDHGQPQHDRNRPQLANAQRGDGLVGGHEAAEALRVHPAVAVGDRFQGDVVHPRMSRRRGLGEVRKLAYVSFGQVPPRGTDLFFDQIEVVE
jgi:3',5'-cyclic AMP phosphodiesterase CpdA